MKGEEVLQGKCITQFASNNQELISQPPVVQRYYVQNPKNNEIRWEVTDPVPEDYTFQIGTFKGANGLDTLYLDSSVIDDDQDPVAFNNLYRVTASSAHHDLNLIAQKAPSAGQKTYGFSFVDKVAEAADIVLINAHIEHYNATGDPNLFNWGGVVHGPATHRSAREGMVAYTVNNRVYSTTQIPLNFSRCPEMALLTG